MGNVYLIWRLIRRHAPATLFHVRYNGYCLCLPCFFTPFPKTMRSTSANDSVSVFKDGKLKPGIYKIQNIVGHTYADIRENTRELCCRPTVALEGKGLVGPHHRFVPIVMAMITFSGKFSLLGLDIPSAGYSTKAHFSSLCTERDNTDRTREARAILYCTRGIKWRKSPYLCCWIPRGLEDGGCQR